LRLFRFYEKRPKIAHNLETVYDRANIAINHFSKSAIASQNLSFYFTCDATWRLYRRSVTSGYKKNKSRISQKRCELERKSQFITNRKSAFAFQNPTLDLTC